MDVDKNEGSDYDDSSDEDDASEPVRDSFQLQLTLPI